MFQNDTSTTTCRKYNSRLEVLTMRLRQNSLWLAAALLTLSLATAPIFALSMERLSLEHLATKNSTILTGTIVDAYSYWNADGTWIVTDFKVSPQEMIKGDVKAPELTITMLGGTVGETTVLIPGAPSLEIGTSYLLFVRQEDLPGAPKSQVLATYTQSVFDIVPDKSGAIAISQAKDVHLFPDVDGKTEVAGGVAGMSLESLKNTIRATLANAAAK